MEEERQRAQLAFLASGQQLEVGDPGALPLPVATLAATTAQSPYVEAAYESGLTGADRVRLQAARRWPSVDAQAREHHALLAEHGGLFFGDETLSLAELLEKYQRLERQAAAYLLQ